MNVDKRVVAIGDMLTYEIVARNVGGRTYDGALTVNTHTPKGTLRCGTTQPVQLCTTPGDYDGSSRDPNAPHTNPPGVTRLVSIRPGRTVLLETLILQVGPDTPGTILYDHAHVDGLASITEEAPDVTTEAALLKYLARAPNVTVER
jgi:uncharacterized repeat protein (TIGR01451 family)